MITNYMIDSFETLATKFSIGNNNCFRYLQIRSYLMKQQSKEQSENALVAEIYKQK